MSTVQQAIEVSAPLHTVYERLASFESYPQFMTGVEQVIQTSSNETHWIMNMDGQRREFDALITECSLDERVSWSTMDGPLLAETITLRPMGETRTQVVAQLEADAAFLLSDGRHGQTALTRRLKADLAGLKRLVEHGDGSPDRLVSGTGTILEAGASTKSMTSSTAFGGPGPAPEAASPAVVAARMRHRAAELRDGLAPGTHIGTAAMGHQAMFVDDVRGEGMINEEERGSAHDL